MFRRTGRPIVAAWVLASAFVLGAAEAQVPPAPDRWVTDAAGFLRPETVRALDATLEDFERQTGHQILVYIGRTTSGDPIEDFALRAFESWRVGRKSLDDGLLLLVMAEDRKVRIEVGYGLEGVVPDIVAGRIINDVLVPKVRAGDPDGAVRDAVAEILSTISGPPEKPGEGAAEPESRRRGTGNSVLLVIGAIVFLILFITNPRLALWILFSLMSGGRGGGGFSGGRSSGGGGFRGGGGRSGGGGASGGW
jgi:uncharacterized protein